MAQGKKRASVRRGKARRSKAPTRATAKRSAVKAKSKKTALRAKTMRVDRKQLTPSKAQPPQPSTKPPIEVIKVKTVNEPAPGTVIVTEYEEVHVPAKGRTTERGNKQAGLDLPAPEED